MRFSIFLCGLAIMATGVAAMYLLKRPQSLEFLEQALRLGGGIVICGIFSVKMRWHGIVGAGIMALLGVSFGLGNLPRLGKFLAGERSHGTAPVLETGVTLICLLLLLHVIRALSRERVRRMLEAAE